MSSFDWKPVDSFVANETTTDQDIMGSVERWFLVQLLVCFIVIAVALAGIYVSEVEHRFIVGKEGEDQKKDKDT